MVIFKLWTIFTGLFLLVLCWRTRRFTTSLVSLHQQKLSPQKEWPKISIIIPACNEANTIEAAAASLLKVQYPNLEIVLVNDRSTDETGRIMDRLAAADPRLKVVHIDSLPEGWLGKVHALSQGIDMTSSEWILLTDADVHFAETALRKAISYAQVQRLDFLTAIPDLFTRSFGIQVMMAQLYHQASLFFDPRRLNDPRSKVCYGQGAFLLFRREVYERSEGLEWLRMEVVDDGGLALLLRRAGARMGAVSGHNEIKLEWYSSVRNLVKGLEKNAFALCSYSLLPLMAVIVATWMVFAGFAVFPWLTHSGGYVAFSGVCLMAYLVAIVSQLKRLMEVRTFGILLFPVAFIVLPWIFLRAAVLTLWRGGVSWRGTFYSLEELKANQRMKLGNLVFTKGNAEKQV